jgi:hypothetical protein
MLKNDLKRAGQYDNYIDTPYSPISSHNVIASAFEGYTTQAAIVAYPLHNFRNMSDSDVGDGS